MIKEKKPQFGSKLTQLKESLQVIIDLREVFEGSEDMYLRIIDELKKNLEKINDLLVEEAKEKNFDF